MSDWRDQLTPAPAEAPAASFMDQLTPAGPTPQQKAVTSANDNGDEAAKSLQISKRTGVPATLVQGDLPGYAEHDRKQSAIKAVQNPFIAKYVDGNPMAAKVSGDDYDKLDEVSQTLQALHPELVRGRAQVGVFAAIPEIAGMLGSAPGREKLVNALTQLPIELAKGLAGPLIAANRAYTQGLNSNNPEQLNEAISAGIAIALGQTGKPSSPTGLGRDIRFGRKAEGGTEGPPLTSFDDFMGRVRGMKTRQEIDDFIASKHEGPSGAMLAIEHAKAGSEALDRAVETAQGSKTLERSPELFAEAAEAHDPGNVHVDGTALMELYQKEGKVPAPGDGLLGDVPGIAGKIAAAEATGGEVTIPVSQYIAYGKDAHEALRDNVRLHDDGVTLEEAKGIQELKPEDEKIFGPAVRVNGKHYTGMIHPDAMEVAAKELGVTTDELYELSQAQEDPYRKAVEGEHTVSEGFITTGGRYLTRAEAYDLAKKQNQIERDESLGGPGHLSSEDLKADDTIDYGNVNNLLSKLNKNKTAQQTVSATAIEQKQLGIDTRVFMNMVFKDGKALKITEGEFKAYSDKIARQEQMVLDHAVKMDKTEIARVLTPDWKRKETAVRDEVITEFKTQGRFAAEKYLREKKIDIAHERAAEVAEGLAPLFGFENGQDLLRGLESIDIERAATGKGPQVQLRDAIKEETAQRMEERHGVLAENIAKEARQMALSDHTFDVLADEVRILSKATGIAPPLSRSQMVDWAKQSFEGSNIRDGANWEKHRRAVEKGGREAEQAMLKGDFQEAFQAKQRQMLAATVAKESLKLQAVVDRAEKKIDKFSSEAVIPGIDQAHLEQIRQVLASVGLPQYIAPLADTGSLRDFVTESQGQLAVAPWLMDGTQPKLADMSVAQFREFADSLQSLEHVGRAATKMENAHGQAELQNVIYDVKRQLDRFKFIDQPNHPSIPQRAASVGRKIIGAHLLVERMFDYIDRFDPHGPLTEWVDRPLRDANTKEIVLTEQVTKMLKDLRPYVDASINDKIMNTLIPDAHDRSGFLSMTRQDLRVLMLNMGNWSNIKKIVEGFGVNEMDLRRMIAQNATAKDVAWVNGIWGIFKHLKPLADEVQLKDTGVPVDHIPAVSWEFGGNGGPGSNAPVPMKLDGGYYPLAYDKYNSDIQGHIAKPLFDSGYFAATTPHGYTQARTEYKGAIDLTGTFLASKIQGMVHDIAFRGAVRNAEKLISNQEFRVALAQRWGKEAADLLPGWIRDIANSHNLDDNYAREFVRAAALVRQNVTSSLIGYNPSTFIKHGFTAAVMSAGQVGAKALGSATKELGFSGAGKNFKELISKTDRVPDEAFMQAFRDLIASGERGDNVRQFILDSSAVMRNRQRQHDESIRGATDAINQIGAAKTFADFRHRQIHYGRIAVAWSDQMSAMPTWWAAYKKAYLGGEAHADAVFIADKAMSRAHGSNFIGDKPAVTRIGNNGPGEVARWFTGLYNFWNHQFNNLMQLTWDIKAALDGPPKVGGAGGPPNGLPPPNVLNMFKDSEGNWRHAPEPGANAAAIGYRVLGILAIIYIEEQAGAALDEDHRGIGSRVLSASLRYFGGGIVGLRELTNGFAHGYEPSTGLIGTIGKAIYESVEDLKKSTGAKAGLAKNWITHTATLLAMGTGIGATQIGKTATGIKRLLTGEERTRDLNKGSIFQVQGKYRQLARTGFSKPRTLHK